MKFLRKKYWQNYREWTLCLILMLVGLIAHEFITPLSTVFAQALHLPDASKLGSNIPQTSGGDTASQIKSLIASIARNVKYIAGAAATGFIMYTGFRLVIARGDESEYTNQKNAIVSIVIGISIVGASSFVGDFLDITDGGLLKDKSIIIKKAQIFDQELQIIMTFIKYILGSIAIAMIVLSGFKMITMGDEEETVTAERKKIAAGAFALIVIMVANTFINQVVFVVDKTRVPRGGVKPIINLDKGLAEIKGVTNFILKFIGPMTVLMLIVGAIMYVSSGGNEERRNHAKTVLTTSFLAMVLIFGAYGLVGAFINGEVSF